ncbi:Mitochondrial fission protein [Coemansia sp. RSA 1722]|nr:Mitochondrial fission protein [Coemansia sp. RSA 485]KAJ2601952.1 Mitochondrial fission protein [Coemansia sp. RSA 1722]
MRRQSVAGESSGSDRGEDNAPYSSSYDTTSSQGFLVRLVNKILFRNGPHSVVNRLMRSNSRGLDGRDTQNRLLTAGSSRLARAAGSNKRQSAATYSADTLLKEAPAIGSVPSLLSGFNAFLHKEHQGSDSHDTKRTASVALPLRETDAYGRKGSLVDEESVEPLGMGADEFYSMLEQTPLDMAVAVLSERREEYGEYLRRLEAARRLLVQKLKDVDVRILQAVSERKDIEGRLSAAEGQQKEVSLDSSKIQSDSAASLSVDGSDIHGNRGANAAFVEDVSDDGDAPETESAGIYEQDDVPRLRKLEHLLRGHYSAVTALDSDPVMGLLASGSLDTQVRVWDLESGDCKYVIKGHSDTVRSVQFYERFLLTAASDNRIRMWDLSLLDSVQPEPSTMIMRDEYVPLYLQADQDPDDLNESHDHDRDEESQNFSASQYANYDLRMIQTMQSTTPPVTPTICQCVPPLELCCENTFIGHSDAVTCMQAESGTLITGSADKTVREWDLNTGMLRQAIDVAWATRTSTSSVRVSGAPPATSSMSPSSQRRQRWSRSPLPIGTDSFIPGASSRGTDLGDGGFIGALQFYEFALATGTADGALRLWDLRTAQPHRQLSGHSQPITSLRFDDRTVLTGSLDGTVLLWDLRTGSVIQRFAFGAPVTSVQLAASRQQHNASYGVQCWVAASDPWLHKYSGNSMQHVEYATDYGLLNNSQSRSHFSSISSGSENVTRIFHQDQDSTLISGDSSGVVKVWGI